MDFIAVLSKYFSMRIALSFLVFIFSCALIDLVRRWWGVRKELSLLIKDVQTTVPRDVNFDSYDLLSKRLKRSQFIKTAWNRFEETVIQVKNDDKIGDAVKVYSTRYFLDFFPKEEFMARKLSASRIRKVPSIITSFGLLFTFLFIVFSLLHLHQLPSAPTNKFFRII